MQLSQDDLASHFPGKADRIERLRRRDPHFRELCDSYAEVNRAIARRATDAVFTGRDQERALRRQRDILKMSIRESVV